MTQKNYFEKISEEIKAEFGASFDASVEVGTIVVELYDDMQTDRELHLFAKKKLVVKSDGTLDGGRKLLEKLDELPGELVLVDFDGDANVTSWSRGRDINYDTYNSLFYRNDGNVLVVDEVVILGRARSKEIWFDRLGYDYACTGSDGYHHPEWANHEDFERDKWSKNHGEFIVKAHWEDTSARFYGMNDDDVRREFRPEAWFQIKEYAHGLAAYSGHQSPEDIIKNLDGFGDITGEICCAWHDEEIGPCGVYVRGTVTIASTIDLRSYRTEDGRRHFDTSSERAQDGIITKKEEFTQSKWDHCEFLLEYPVITGVWLKDWAEKKNPKLTRMLKKWCSDNYIPLTVVGNRH